MEAELDQVVKFRRELHQHPEVSGKEFDTQKRIIDRLQQLGIRSIFAVGGTGVMVRFQGESPGKTVMLRADTDALPIQEVNDFLHRSSFPGISHKCGHDGHTAILYGVAKHLMNHPLQKGVVMLLFQPAEENGEGAKAILNDLLFDFTPDFVFAFHNIPGYTLHKVVVRKDSFTAAAKSIIIKIKGKTSHAAEPELGINPAKCIAEIISFFESVSKPNIDAHDFALATPVFIKMGEKSYGVSAGYGEVHYTLRTWNNQVMENFTFKIMAGINRITTDHRLDTEIEWTEEFFANQNKPEIVDMIKSIAQEQDFDVEEKTTPFKWGEDFGLFTAKFSGAMFGIGSGEGCPALHNPDYDFPDQIIPTGIKMFTELIERSIHE
ncbi:MAG: amidohydrolase [Cyclobacteriaceae bacterium]|jgi:amidohydrolase